MNQENQVRRTPVWVRVLCVLLPLLVVCAYLWASGYVLRPKYMTVSPEGSLTAAYYTDVAEISHDVLFVGDCEVYEAFIPAVLWETYGISSYVRGSAQQLVWQSYYLLEDALTYETPEVVVFNVLALKYGTPQSEAFNRMTLDGMRWSRSKADAIRASMTEGESFLSYVLPSLRFHSRWSELTAEDWRYAFTDPPIISDSGYLIRTDIQPYDPAAMPDPDVLTDPKLPASSMAWLEKMVGLCREKGIRLVLVKAPTNTWRYWWYDEWDAQVAAFAEDNGLDYFNLIPASDAMGIDPATDSYDGGFHLNVYGAEKLTVYFGRILRETCDVTDRRDDPAYADIWAERVRIFRAKIPADPAANS